MPFERQQDGNVLEKRTQKIGVRRARVVQEKLIDQDGLSFFFEVNNVRLFCGGLSSTFLASGQFKVRGQAQTGYRPTLS
jgi:hypothetical protein